MSTIGSSGKPQSRRYSPAEKQQAVRMVRALREELGTSQGTVKQAEIDSGETPGVTTVEQQRIKELEQEVRELRRANSILRSASAFFAELDRPQR